MNVERSHIAGRLARIAMTPACNIKCAYCEGAAGFRPGKPGAMEDFRREPLESGIISVDILIAIIGAIHRVGFTGITLTGGEPTLNPNWDFVIEESQRLGMEKAELTTNGTTIKRYMYRSGGLPRGLSLVKISLDTPDPELFREIRGGANLADIIEGIETIKGKVKTRANRVVLRSDLSKFDNYLNFIKSLGFEELLLLDLVFHPNRDNRKDAEFFAKEYVPAEELMVFLKENYGMEFTSDRYGHQAQYGNLRVILKDSNLTLRNNICDICPIYCQEGLYTMRVATDGNITLCPDFKAELSSINAVGAIKKGNLEYELARLVDILETAREEETLVKFIHRHNLNLAKNTDKT